LQGSLLERARFGSAVLEGLIETAHQLSCRAIVNGPQAHNKGGSSRIKESSGQPEQFIPFPDRAHSGFARAQYRQFRAQLQVEYIKQVQPAIAQLQRRKHRIVGAKNSVCCDMQFAGCGTISTQLIFPSFTPDKKKALGQKGAKCSDLFIDMGRHLVGSSQHKVLFGPLDFLLAANLQYRGAGAAADGVSIDEVVCAVIQRVKRDIVKNVMRNKNQQ